MTSYWKDLCRCRWYSYLRNEAPPHYRRLGSLLELSPRVSCPCARALCSADPARCTSTDPRRRRPLTQVGWLAGEIAYHHGCLSSSLSRPHGFIRPGHVTALVPTTTVGTSLPCPWGQVPYLGYLRYLTHIPAPVPGARGRPLDPGCMRHRGGLSVCPSVCPAWPPRGGDSRVSSPVQCDECLPS